MQRWQAQRHANFTLMNIISIWGSFLFSVGQMREGSKAAVVTFLTINGLLKEKDVGTSKRV